jgi:uncharacterized repeat protein (TIGR03803 family)
MTVTLEGDPMRAFPVCLSLVIVLAWLPSPVAAQQPTLEVLHGFVDPPRNPYTAPVQGPDGWLYGTASGDGGDGTIYRIDTAGTFETVHNFRGDDGSDPRGDLILASDGFLYGTTLNGGAAGAGTVYRLDPASGALTTVHSFTATASSGPESFFVRLSLPTNATIADDEAVVSIEDDEVPGGAAAWALESFGTAQGPLRSHAGVQ